MASWSSKNWILQVQDILLTIDLVEAYMREHTMETFVTDHKAIVTVCYNLRLIGEATSTVPREMRQHYKNVPWVHLRNLRNTVTNDYFRQNPRILWMTCLGRVFPAAIQLAEVLKETAPIFEKLPEV